MPKILKRYIWIIIACAVCISIIISAYIIYNSGRSVPISDDDKLAELSREDMKGYEYMMEEMLKLTPFIKQIQEGKIDPNHTAIIYSILSNTCEVYIHQQNGAKENTTYISPDGHSEAVFDKNGKPVKDGINDGSYNYYHPSKEPLYHFSFDISPWIMWGQSETDTTTVKSRIYAYMGDMEGGIRRTFVQQNKPEGKWKSDGQVQALAVFLRAIKEGKAESLFTLFDSESSVSDEQLIDVLTKLNQGLEKVY